MARYQPVRGNPEDKLSIIIDDFSGGVNTTTSDDLTPPNELRQLRNFRLEALGDLETREGWGKTALHDVINDKISPTLFPTEPTVMREGEDVLVEFKTDKDILYFTLDINSLKKGDQVVFDIEGEDIHSSTGNTISLLEEKRVVGNRDEAGELVKSTFLGYVTLIPAWTETEDEVRGTKGRYWGDIKVERDVVTGISLDEEGRTLQTTIVAKVPNICGKADASFVIHRVVVPEKTIDIKSFTSQVYLTKLIRNDHNIVERLMRYKTLEEFKKDVNSNAEYTFTFLIVYRKQRLPVTDNVSIGIETFTIKEGGNKIESDTIHIVSHDDTRLKPYLQDLGSSSLTLSNINYAVSKNSVITTGTDFGLIEIISNKAKKEGSKDTYEIKYHAPKRSGVKNSAYKPSPLEVRRVGFNVLGTSPLTWIDATGTTSKSIQGIYVTDLNDVPAAVLPMGKGFKLHIMYTGAKSDFDVKLSEEVGKEDRKELKYESKIIRNESGLCIMEINFTTQPFEEVEFEIKFKGDDSTTPMYDYYNIGQIPPDAKPVESIDVGTYGLTQMWDRYVYYKGDTLWYSDFSRFDYVPNLNYITLPLRPNDNIVNITFFRTSYMVFTQEKIFKISGMFDTDETRVDLVSDTIGCIAPNSVAMVENKLFFLSNRGLVALKAEAFRQNLENVEIIDDKISNMIDITTSPYAFSLKNQYILFLNNNYKANYERETYQTLSGSNRDLRMPNALRYYTETNSFAFDYYEDYNHPLFIFNEGGKLISHRYKNMYVFTEASIVDFSRPFSLELETPATHFGYPSHEKKYKQLIIKFGKEAYQQDIDVSVIVDGQSVHEETLFAESDVESFFEEDSRFHIRQIRLPSLKGKNIAVNIKTDSKVPLNIMSISYIYKLGKIRERRAYR